MDFDDREDNREIESENQNKEHDWTNYYNRIRNRKEYKAITRYIESRREKNLEPGTVIDIGCGSGVDSKPFIADRMDSIWV